MPSRARRFCASPSCRVLVERGRCATHAREQQRHHGRFKQGATSYKSARWQAARQRFFRRPENALCRWCRAVGRVTAANTIDHVTPHRGDEHLFWDESNWAPSCVSCNSKRAAKHVGWRQQRAGNAAK